MGQVCSSLLKGSLLVLGAVLASNTLHAAEPRIWWVNGQPQSVAQIRNCNAQQTQVIQNIDAIMGTRIDEVVGALPQYTLSHVYESFVVPKDREWIEGGARNRNYQIYHAGIQNVFLRMQQASHSGINFECKNANTEPNCQKGEVLAYVLFIGNTPLKNLYLCSGFFDNPAGTLDTLMHELSHYAAGTDDLAGSWLDTKNPNIPLAAKDAYHIEQFSTGEVQRTLLRQIWFWNWPAKPK